ncbi:MAG: hypothetical protein J0653_08230, partial [Deltaproteobacteria bacterium]|nr:hypothetical protein [Deltaproteobacteria bacterium]
MQAADNLLEAVHTTRNSNSVKDPCKREFLTVFGIPLRISSRSIALYFVIAGCCWVLITNLLLGHYPVDTVSHTRLHLASGLFFVLLTAVLLYQLISRYAADLS